MKQWKKIASTMLTAAMAVVSIAGCGQNGNTASDSKAPSKEVQKEVKSEAKTETETEAGSELSWLNTSGSLPIVEEGTEKTLKIAAMMDLNSGEPEDTWFYRFIEERMNINLEVTKFTVNNYSEFLSMAFADNDLPDIIIGGWLSSSDLMTYGAYEGQIMDLAPYITEELTPNLYSIYKEHPEYKDVVSDSEGHIWSLGYINDPTDKGQVPRMFVNYDWLEEAGLEAPRTTDELLTVLRAFKERGDDIVPLGGCAAAVPPTVYILSAFGYNTVDGNGNTICTRDGKVVLPTADREAYGAYLEYMNTLYSEGLIDKDYYTMDATTSSAVVSAGKAGFIGQAPLVYMSDSSAWWGAEALTSEYNQKAFWPANMTTVNAGQFVVSANCQEPELAMAFADWFFTEEHYEMSVNGPSEAQTEDLVGLQGAHFDPETKSETWPEYEENKNLYSSVSDYRYKKVVLWSYKLLGLGNTSGVVRQRLAGVENPSNGYPDVSSPERQPELRKTITNGDMLFRTALQDTLCPVVELGVTPYVYLDVDTTVKLANMKTALDEYANAETAKFITGARPLSELDDYFDQMEALGALEYVKIYQDYYNLK